MGLAFDASGRLHVANLAGYNNTGTQKVTIYPAGASGNVTPLATIQGGATGLFNPLGISVDAAGDIYVANYGNTDQGPTNSGTSIRVYSAGSNGNAAPVRTILGYQSEPTGLAIDGSGKLFVANFAGQFISVFAPGANGNATATAVISGNNTGINRPAYVTF